MVRQECAVVQHFPDRESAERILKKSVIPSRVRVRAIVARSLARLRAGSPDHAPVGKLRLRLCPPWPRCTDRLESQYEPVRFQRTPPQPLKLNRNTMNPRDAATAAGLTACDVRFEWHQDRCLNARVSPPLLIRNVSASPRAARGLSKPPRISPPSA